MRGGGKHLRRSSLDPNLMLVESEVFGITLLIDFGGLGFRVFCISTTDWRSYPSAAPTKPCPQDADVRLPGGRNLSLALDYYRQAGRVEVAGFWRFKTCRPSV